MSMTLDQLISHCKCGVFVRANEHTDYYESLEDWIYNNAQGDWFDYLSDEEKAEIMEANNWVEIQFYPDTPNGFYVVAAPSFDTALGKAAKIIEG